MITLTINANGAEMIFIISAGDAWEIIEKFKNKYPNVDKSNISMQAFMDKWCPKGQ